MIENIYLEVLHVPSDGRPAPETLKQSKWRNKRAAIAERIERLREEVIEMEQEELERQFFKDDPDRPVLRK